MGKNSTYNYKRYCAKFLRMMKHTKEDTPEEARREHILKCWILHGTAAACVSFGISRSTLYSWQKRKEQGCLKSGSRRPHHTRTPITDWAVVEKVISIRKAFPYLGKEKIAVLMKQDNVMVSASTIGRIIARYKLPSAPRQWIARRKSVRRLRKPPDYRIDKPGDLVGLDTIVIQQSGVKRYIMTAIDYHSRIAIARMYHSPNSKNATDLLLRMQTALGIPIRAVNTDNGSEFFAHFHTACQKLSIHHFYTRPRTPKMNAYIERFNRTIQEEASLPSFYEPITVWNAYIAHYLMQYNFYRPHTSLDYKTPATVFLYSSPHQSSMLWTHTYI